MEIARILRRLERASQTYPAAAVEAAIEKREAITPELLRVLEETLERPEDIERDFEYVGHYSALLLLAQFRETAAYPLVVRFVRLPEKVLDQLGGDFFADELARILARVCGGDLGPIQSLIEDGTVNAWSRGGALDSLKVLVRAGEKSREEILDYAASLFRGKLEREQSYVWDALVALCCDLRGDELMGEIEKAFEEGLADPGFMEPGDVREDLARTVEEALAELAQDEDYAPLDNAAEAIRRWCVGDAEEEDAPLPDYLDVTPFDEDDPEDGPVPDTFVREGPKIGRNDPCVCGSGKKFKKCCGK